MIEWNDQGAVLSTRKHGETSVILDVFTENHGRVSGVVRGGASKRLTPVLQPGSQVAVRWKARLEEHIGSFTVEPIKSRAVQVMAGRQAIFGLNAMLSLIRSFLPEREAQNALYHNSMLALDLLGQDDVWPLAYLRWEMSLLEELGFALDLSCCAVTGGTENLAYISPKTGRAVSEAGAGEWARRLLPYPKAFERGRVASPAEIVDGLKVTGYFMEHHIAPQMMISNLPVARLRLIDYLTKSAGHEI